MKTKQITNLEYVTRNGATDTDFYKALVRQQRKRQAIYLAKLGLYKLGAGAFKAYAKAYSDINHTDDYEAIYGTVEVTKRIRNTRGQYAAL